MRILCICDEGNNRSVTLASLLKYWHNDVISAGLNTNTPETLIMLLRWCEVVIITEERQRERVDQFARAAVNILCPHITCELADFGPDVYPRPHNPQLLKRAKEWLEANKSWLKNTGK